MLLKMCNLVRKKVRLTQRLKLGKANSVTGTPTHSLFYEFSLLFHLQLSPCRVHSLHKKCKLVYTQLNGIAV